MTRYGPTSEQFMQKHYGPSGYVNLKEKNMYPQFEVHMLNETGKGKAIQIAGDFSALLGGLSLICPEGREMAIVKTKLEEACFFSKKAMSMQKENQF
jgi:hypothetical protein